MKKFSFLFSLYIAVFMLSSVFFLSGCATPSVSPPPANTTKPNSSAIAIDPAKAAESEQYFQAGLKFYEEYEYKKAIAKFSLAITANPSNGKAYAAKGIALCFEENYQEGMALIQKTLEMDPGYVPAFYDMAMAYKLQHKYDESLLWFEKTIQGDPKNTWSYYGISTIHADRGNAQQSLQYLKKAIELDPYVKEVAKEQSHFDGLRKNPDFQALVR